MLTKYSEKRSENVLKPSSFSATVSYLLSSSCKTGFQKVLFKALKGR